MAGFRSCQLMNLYLDHRAEEVNTVDTTEQTLYTIILFINDKVSTSARRSISL